MSTYFSTNDGNFKKFIQDNVQHLSEDEIEEFGKLLKSKLSALDELMEKCEVEKLKDNIGKVRSIKSDIDEIMDEKIYGHFLGCGYGITSVGCLFFLTNPFALTMLGISAAAGIAIGAANGHISSKIRRKLADIDRIVEKDRKQFSGVAPTIRDLDNLMRKYLKESIFDEKTKKFLISAATHVFEKCGSSAASESKMINLLKNLVLANSFAQLYGAISGTLVVTTSAALLPILNVVLQIALFIESVEDKDNVMENLSEEIDKLQEAYDALKIVY